MQEGRCGLKASLASVPRPSQNSKMKTSLQIHFPCASWPGLVQFPRGVFL